MSALHACGQCLRQAQFSPDGRWLLSASFDKAIKLWDGVRGGFVATLRGHVGPVYQVAWSADSRLFVSGSKDSTLKVRHLCHCPISDALCIACLSPVLVSSHLQLLGHARGCVSNPFHLDSDPAPGDNCWCSDGMHAGARWSAVRDWGHRHKGGMHACGDQVWEVASRKLKLDLPGHADEVFTVDWSPDGASVASGGKDQVLRIWRQ